MERALDRRSGAVPSTPVLGSAEPARAGKSDSRAVPFFGFGPAPNNSSIAGMLALPRKAGYQRVAVSRLSTLFISELMSCPMI